MSIAVMILEAAVLSSTLSLDAFIASFAYGRNKIKIPLSSIIAINIVCSGILGISLLAGALIRPYLPSDISNIICFLILFIIGLVKLLDNIAKAVIRKHGGLSKNIRFSFLNFKFVLTVYADPEKADIDQSKCLSVTEAVSLAVALSLDGMAVGFGAALGDVSGMALFLSSFVTDTLAVLLGSYIGNKIAASLRFNMSWLSGVILIIMAFIKRA